MEAAILQFFEGIRCPFLDVFFGCFSVLGEAMVVGGVAILLFWLCPKKAGEQLIMTALTSFPLNSLLKFTVRRARPFTAGDVTYRKPPFLADELDPYASFPSGHTQSSSSLLLAGADVLPVRRRISFSVAGVLILLVMIARMYFGAHYPSDVLTGLALGGIVALFWACVFRFAHEYRYLILLGFAALALIPCFFSPAHDYLQAAGLLSGGAVSLAASTFVLRDRTVPLRRRFKRLLVGIPVTAVAFAFTIFFPEGDAFSLLKWFLIAVAAGLVAPLLFDRLEI